TPTTAVIGHAAGVPYEITLNQGQTYSMAAQYTAGPDHPAGSFITSNKPIAVTIKDDSVGNGSCYDIMGDQLIPTDLIGTDYIVMKGFLYDGAGEAIYVMATQDNTDVFIDGSATPSATINTGQQWSYLLTNPSTFVTTSAPAYILHVTGEGCELAEAVLPPIECTGSRKVYFVRSVDGAFGVNIMTRTENIANFTLNGNATLIPAAAFNSVTGSAGEWMSTQILFSTANIPSEEFTVVENSTGLFHLGTINGGGGGCRYGYFSDFGQSNPLEIDASFCEGDTISIQPNDDYLSYLWSTGDTTAV
ncbi:MAG: IgGFc-binding protein, partial [Flavobacteriales bacterium]